MLVDFDQDTLRTEAGPVLDKVAAALSGLQVTLQVNGPTDAKDEHCYNLDLSQPGPVAASGAGGGGRVGRSRRRRRPGGASFGETRPVAPNEINGKDNPAGRGQNRRVDSVVPNG